jgi:hypothetical protein
MAQAQAQTSMDQAIKFVNSAGTKPDRWWVSFFILCGMGVTTLLFYWHREDQQAMKQSYETVVKANTDALMRVNITLERLERQSQK